MFPRQLFAQAPLLYNIRLLSSNYIFHFYLQLKKMSNSKPSLNPSEPLKVEQEPESMESNGQNNDEVDIHQHLKKKEGVKEHSKLSNGSSKGGKGENPKVTEKRTKRKLPSREEIARIRYFIC